MKKTFAAFVAVAAIAGSLAATPASAQRGLGAAVAGGIIGGAIVGGAIASSRPAYRGPGYGGDAPRPPAAATGSASVSGMVTNGVSAASRSATDLTGVSSPCLDIKTRPLRPGFSFQRAALIERSTASLGQQSTLRPADF